MEFLENIFPLLFLVLVVFFIVISVITARRGGHGSQYMQNVQKMVDEQVRGNDLQRRNVEALERLASAVERLADTKK